ncbi:MAG: hypothetical protein HYS38_02985 [Acidobacteria bacterium]|nr:hypothetical protein [Acidobacteriota bacterium]
MAGNLQAAARAHDIDWAMLAAIGIRESNAGRQMEQTNGGGRGFFQIDIFNNNDITEQQAMELSSAAPYAAQRLARNRYILSRLYTGNDLVHATAASWNMDPLKPGNYTGNPATIDVGTKGGNYGANILDIMECFQ